jgi:proline racemase
MAVLDAMGLMAAGAEFVHEGMLGTRLVARISGRTQVGDYPAVMPEIEAASWITGEHTFVIDRADPLNAGFAV